jgi:RHS repeat-associated protein
MLRTDDVLAVDVKDTKIASLGSYFFTKDAIGSVSEIVNSSGNLIQRYVYSSFGKILKIIGSAGSDIISNPLVKTSYGFTNREHDESGLMYYRARFYDPGTGRFLSVDPHPGAMASPITVINKYIYTANDPINNLDPSGEFLITAIVVGAVIGGAMAHFSGGNILEGILIGAVAGAAGGAAGVWAGGLVGGGIGGAALGTVAGAGAGYLAGGVSGGGIEMAHGGSFSSGFNYGGKIGAVSGGVSGGLTGYFGSGLDSIVYNAIPSWGEIANSTIDRLSWNTLTSKQALMGYGVTAAKYIANRSCGKDKIFSFSAGGKCIDKPKGGFFYEIIN